MFFVGQTASLVALFVVDFVGRSVVMVAGVVVVLGGAEGLEKTWGRVRTRRDDMVGVACVAGCEPRRSKGAGYDGVG